MKKVVIQLNIHTGKEKQKALKSVSSIRGIDSLAMDMEEKKMTIIGDVDPVQVICRLRNSWCAQILTVGSAEEEETKVEEKKDEEKKDEEKKNDDENKEDVQCDYCACHYYNRPQHPYYPNIHYVLLCSDEYPSLCVVT